MTALEYLDPECDRQALYDLMEGAAMRCQAQVIYNRSLPYSEFLKSVYWQYVRSLVFRQWGKRGCAHCKATRLRLDVHHKTYEHQGDELNHLQDLIVLCHDCHTRAHTVPNSRFALSESELKELAAYFAARCQECEGSGWIVTTEGARRCNCNQRVPA